MEHPPTSSALEDSARKFRLALGAVIDGSLPGLDPHLAKVLEATAAEVIARTLNELEARDQTIAALYADRSMVISDTAALGQSVIADRDATIANLRSQLEALNTVSSAVNDGMAILIKDREATIAKLNEHKAGLIRCFEDAVNENADLRAEVEVANKALAEARKDRASIVAFLAAEAHKFDAAVESLSRAERAGSPAVVELMARFKDKADHCRTLAAQIERGDDRQGGE